MPDVIICANFGVEKLRGLGYMGGGQITLQVLHYRAACDVVAFKSLLGGMVQHNGR